MPEIPEQSSASPVHGPEEQKKEMHALALEGLLEATGANMERLREAEAHLLDAREQRVESLRALRRKRARSVLLRRNRQSAVPAVREIVSEHRAQRREIESDITTLLRKIEEFRTLFSEQAEITLECGYDDLAEMWIQKFLALETPFDEEVPDRTQEAVRIPFSRERKMVAAIWRSVRFGICTAIAQGEKVAPAFARHMQAFEREVQRCLSHPRPLTIGT